MTKRMDKKQVLQDAAHIMKAEILHHYNLTPEQRRAMSEAKIEVNDWENLTPALPVVTWEVAGHREGFVALELMGRNKKPIERLGRSTILKCYKWSVVFAWSETPD